MSKEKPGRLPGERHHGCLSGGFLVISLRQASAGVTERGVIGLPVTVTVIEDLYCDGCYQVFRAQARGQRLTDYCRQLLEQPSAGSRYRQAEDKPPTVCGHCPSGKCQPHEAYLVHHADNWSHTPRRHGVECTICLRSGQLISCLDHGAPERARIDAMFSDIERARMTADWDTFTASRARSDESGT